jgi:pyruvate formate lyase activating enzyme
MTQGTILNIQKMSTEDGPGIRTTVFFKGCGLHCAWCHNPESIAFQPEIQWFSVRCLGCRTCITTCPQGALTLSESGLHIDRAKCDGCHLCTEACPANAIEPLGKSMTVDALMAELIKDRAYYEKSNGGITLSGGEPSLQPEFAEEVLKALKAQGIHTALDTCGLTKPENLQRLIPYVDLVLYDLKLIDAEQHQQYTRVRNEQISSNLQALADSFRVTIDAPKLWIRTPLIPNATASEENLTAIGRYIHANLDGLVERWELCAFNNLCRDQYKRLDLHWDYADELLFTAEELDHWGNIARSSGVNPSIISTTGATRVPEPV